MTSRKQNYTEAEKSLLLQILMPFKTVIENKRTDGTSVKSKKDAWDAIAIQYNASHIINERATGNQLSRLWLNIKAKQRTQLTMERQHRMATGGGAAISDLQIDPLVTLIAPGLIVEVPSNDSAREFNPDHIFNDEIPICTDCPGVVKPDIVFFGESLPTRFQDCVQQDFHDVDMLIIMGSSLEVQPFASLIGRVPKSCPRLLINRERTGHQSTMLLSLLGISSEGLQLDGTSVRDVAWLGDCDEGCQVLADKLGWGNELRTLVQTEHERLELEGNLCQPHGPCISPTVPGSPPLATENTPPRPL